MTVKIINSDKWYKAGEFYSVDVDLNFPDGYKNVYELKWILKKDCKIVAQSIKRKKYKKINDGRLR